MVAMKLIHDADFNFLLVRQNSKTKQLVHIHIVKKKTTSAYTYTCLQQR